MAKDFLMPLRNIHGVMHEWKQEKKENYKLCKYLRFPFGKKVYLFGTPTHTNLGDSAIVIAERKFIESLDKSVIIKELTMEEHIPKVEIVSKKISKKSPLLLVGGGNIGNQWMIDENLRRDIIVYSKDNPMLIFPQTIYFTPDEKGEEETKKSKNVYNGNKKLCIAAREQVSFELMKKLYPDARIMLVPDIVLSTTKDTYGIEIKNRKGVMLCMRSDVERSIVDNEFQSIVDYIKELQLSFYSTDMHSEHIVTKENRYNDVKEKMEEFSRSKLVITDRLHGMIFAAITETPCIVFSNYNHKVKGTYEWIKHLPYIKYVESVEEAKNIIPELLKMDSCVFDNEPLKPYFEQLADVIKQML